MENSIELNGETYIKKVEAIEDFRLWEVGQSYHIETYTKYFTGEVVGETESHILLKNACYIASTGVFSDYVNGSDPSEAEPYASESIVRIRKDAEVSSIKRDLVLRKI